MGQGIRHQQTWYWRSFLNNPGLALWQLFSGSAYFDRHTLCRVCRPCYYHCLILISSIYAFIFSVVIWNGIRHVSFFFKQSSTLTNCSPVAPYGAKNLVNVDRGVDSSTVRCALLQTPCKKSFDLILVNEWKQFVRVNIIVSNNNKKVQPDRYHGSAHVISNDRSNAINIYTVIGTLMHSWMKNRTYVLTIYCNWLLVTYSLIANVTRSIFMTMMNHFYSKAFTNMSITKIMTPILETLFRL